MPSLTTTGSPIQWSTEYELGLKQVDLQHKALVQMLGDAWQALVRNDREKALHLVQRLEDYTTAHFAEEEAFMRRIGYPDFDAHKERHDFFVQRIAREKAAIASGTDISLDLFHFLRDWLVQHIRVEDRKYAAFEARQPSSPSLLSSFFRIFRT